MFGRYRVPAVREPKELRSTLSYIYYTDDKKGEGATGGVFGGREKKSGERVAVKVFNNVSHRRPDSVQEREFDVLLKLKHPNIVKLLAIEEDSHSHDRVIVMELCVGGSLFNVLDKPENAFGLEEREFLILLRDVSQGMKHLQDKTIVHRDLKPGNIMCCYQPDGSPIYKLADFGAARELAEGENFVSIYGTEEYLHPDVYERAVLRKPMVRPFTASVDLWSIGVTLSHAATGLLPFRPYGGRRNRATMHQMTAQKASGIISGVQKDSENGRIEWSKELPKTTRMSQGLRHLVEEMLAGLLESDVSKMWSFSTFFNFAQSVVSKTVLDVFYVQTSQLLKVYMNPLHTFAEFQEQVAIQTAIQSSNQMLVFDGAVFYPDSSIRCRSFPNTSPENPVLLFNQTFHSTTSPILPVVPSVQQVQTKYSLSTDALATKRNISTLFCWKRKQEQLLLIQKLHDKAVKAFTNVVKDDDRHLQFHLLNLEGPKRTLPLFLDTIVKRVDAFLLTCKSFERLANGKRMHIDRMRDSMEILWDETQLKMNDIQRLCLRHGEVAKLLNDTHRAVVDEDNLTKAWTNQTQCQTTDKCMERFDVMFYSLLEIHSNFCRDSKHSSLPFNAEQIHKMEKIKFNEIWPKLVSLVKDHCEANWFNKHSEMMEWLRWAYGLRERIKEADQELTHLVSDFTTEETEIVKFRQICDEKIDSEFGKILSFPDKGRNLDFPECGCGMCSNHKTYSKNSNQGSPLMSLQTTLPEETDRRQSCQAATHTDQTVKRTAVLLGVNAKLVADNYTASEFCVRNHTCPIPVPSDLKQGFLKWHQERPDTENTMNRCNDLTEIMKNVSLDVNDPGLDLYGCSGAGINETPTCTLNM